MGGVEEDAVEVPLAVREMDEVDAGVGEADGGELEAAAPEGADAEGRVDGGGTDDGLVAECGVFVDDKVFEREAGDEDEDADLLACFSRRSSRRSRSISRRTFWISARRKAMTPLVRFL